MSAIKDGGTAFPVAPTMNPDGTVWYHGKDGMSLRDWFAGMALQGILASGEFGAERMRNGFKCDVVIMSYMAADEMLDAREGKEEK